MYVQILDSSFLRVSGKPLLRELSNDVVPLVGSKWYSLGVQLLDEQDVKLLTTLESDFRGDAETCCTKMLERWLDIVASANWELLIAGLRSPGVKLHKLANELTTKLGGVYTSAFVCVRTTLCTHTHTHLSYFLCHLQRAYLISFQAL